MQYTFFQSVIMARVLLSSGIFCSMLLLTMAWNFRHNLNMPRKHSLVRRNAYNNHTEVINFWEKHKNEFVSYGDNKEVVLVMGNTGSGKTTLVSALIRRKLNATRLEGQPYLVFVDEDNKIGTSTSSNTLIPEIIFDEIRNVTFVDCSGFRDNRDIEYEISAVHFQNVLMNQVEKIKFVFVINYNSLKINGNKNDFDDLIEHIGEFIKDISKFHGGIALVVTKVENIYDDLDDGTHLLLNDDQSVLNGIANYLEKKKETYREKIKNSEKYEVYVGLIDVILQKKNNSFIRLAIFRQATRRGLLENMPKTKKEIDIIAKMIVGNLQYVKVEKNDFAFALSHSLRNIVNNIVDGIFRNTLMNQLHKIGNEIILHYSRMEQQFSDIIILREQILRAYDTIFSIKDVNGLLQFFQKLLDASNTLNIPLSLTNLKTISEEIKKLYFFITVSNSNEDLHILSLKNEMLNIKNLIYNLKNYYDFLDNLQENLAAYHSQRLKNDNRIANIITSCIYSTYETAQNITDLENIVNETNSDKTYKKIKTLKLNRFQLKHLKAVFEVFRSKLEFSCTSSLEQMTVKGYNVKMSDVVNNHCWANAIIIQIFALNKIFIDCTINKTGAEAQLFIIAPTWEIRGGPKIILDGKAGDSWENSSAKSSSSNYKNAENGLPGLPGGSAGNFFSIGEKFINLEYLEIHANGGIGGPGQHGGNGADRIVGEELSESFFEIDQKVSEMEIYLYKHKLNYMRIMYGIDTFVNIDGHTYSRDVGWTMEVSGQPPKKPSAGGDGGSGGKGGYPGKIVINSLGTSVNINTSNNSGSTGLAGQGGHGGKGTSDTRKVRFNYQIKLFGNLEFSNITWTERVKVPDGKDGEPGSSTGDGKLSPKLAMAVTSPYKSINSFKSFLRTKLIENIKESELRRFIDKLENNEKIRAEYNTIAFVKEFEEMENQYLELRDMIDFVSFYHSLLNRIGEYAKSETILENIKVLSYIYTAALTKLITLNKKKKDQTVVDLPKYLNTIEKSVKEIDKSHHLQIVQKYRDDYKNTLNMKIQEANSFIQNTVEPEIDKLWDESDTEIEAIINEIDENINLTRNRFEMEKTKIRDMMQLRAALLSLKLVAIALSFFGPIGTGVSVAVISATSIAEEVLLDTSSNLGGHRIPALSSNLKPISRVTKVVNKNYQLAAVELSEIKAKIIKNSKKLSEAKKTKLFNVKNIRKSEEEIQKLYNKALDCPTERNHLQNEKEKHSNNETKRKKVTGSESNKNHGKRSRRNNRVKSGSKQKENNQGVVEKTGDQTFECIEPLEALEEMKNRVYDVISPDLYQIEETINLVESSINGSSHAKLDLTKWNVRTTLKKVKLMLQKFTHKMSVELQSNLIRYMEKIDEGFSILIDIYDRIDSYSDSIKQAEYIAHIESAPIDDIQVTDSELSSAVNNLKLIIHSNILTEKYMIALHAFKQHFFPFAARVLQRFQLPTGMWLNDTETLRSNIIDKIKEMKNHIDERETTIGKYSKYIHRKKVFDSETIGSSPFYMWKYDTIKDEIQQLLNGSKIIIRADISKGLFYNAIKYNDIGIKFKLNNAALQSSFTSVLKNFALTMTMVGNNYYRCGEQYYFISFDDDITISYTLTQDENNNWIDPNEVYTLIHGSHTFLSPYGMWNIKLQSTNKSVSFHHLNVYANEAIDVELIGQGYYIEQHFDFNFDVCNEYLNNFYDVENIVQVLS